MEVDDKLRQMIRDLGRLLSDAILESSEASDVVRRLREEGYCLYLLIGPDDEEADTPRGQLTLGAGAADGSENGGAQRNPPSFVIRGHDLAFLKSIGIDPTRSLRRRRKP
jgi:hypothetical protein